MAEYINVEKPFLDKLQHLGWKVINQGQGIPQIIAIYTGLMNDLLSGRKKVVVKEELETQTRN
jgi:hypothetical protein